MGKKKIPAVGDCSGLLEWAPKSYDICPLKKKAEENLRQTEERHEHSQRGNNVKVQQGHIAATQGMPRTAGSHHPKAGSGENGVSF